MPERNAELLSAIPGRYADATGARPMFLLQGVHALFAAKWRLPPYRVTSPWAPHHALGYRVSGTTTVTRKCCGIEVRKVPAIGSVTFSPGDWPIEWSSESTVEAIHVYIAADAPRRFAEQHLDVADAPKIHDFFGIQDPWLSGYFQLLDSECTPSNELAAGDAQGFADSLLLDQTEHLLLRHLVCNHSDAQREAARRVGAGVRVTPLGRGVTRRIEDHIEANLHADMSLQTLAGLAHMSVDHFLRAFRAATGKTPHRFVLDRRLERAAAMLKADEESIGDIARACGFRSAAHFSVKFHARFRVTPSQYRRSP